MNEPGQDRQHPDMHLLSAPNQSSPEDIARLFNKSPELLAQLYPQVFEELLKSQRDDLHNDPIKAAIYIATFHNTIYDREKEANDEPHPELRYDKFNCLADDLRTLLYPAQPLPPVINSVVQGERPRYIELLGRCKIELWKLDQPDGIDTTEEPANNQPAPNSTDEPPPNLTTIRILPDARPGLIAALLPFIESEQHQSLIDLINDQTKPNEPIVFDCTARQVADFFTELRKLRKLRDPKRTISEWFCQHLGYTDEQGNVKSFQISTLSKYLEIKR